MTPSVVEHPTMLGSLRDSLVRLSSQAGHRLRCSIPGGGDLPTG